ncbi:hypothetical protein B0H17DRAFT_1133080 [Mycena rosella]|uniref:Uncharacterized protein n=1 Tax=Mycena rosella TaxID=1033263 RepID=A0AAD7GFL9_MYCRO|nr:hypothetical protein B0H17DRAFT_1133080 [Mycena rosella]
MADFFMSAVVGRYPHARPFICHRRPRSQVLEYHCLGVFELPPLASVFSLQAQLEILSTSSGTNRETSTPSHESEPPDSEPEEETEPEVKEDNEPEFDAHRPPRQALEELQEGQCTLHLSSAMDYCVLSIQLQSISGSRSFIFLLRLPYAKSSEPVSFVRAGSPPFGFSDRPAGLICALPGAAERKAGNPGAASMKPGSASQPFREIRVSRLSPRVNSSLTRKGPDTAGVQSPCCPTSRGVQNLGLLKHQFYASHLAIPHTSDLLDSESVGGFELRFKNSPEFSLGMVNVEQLAVSWGPTFKEYDFR